MSRFAEDDKRRKLKDHEKRRLLQRKKCRAIANVLYAQTEENAEQYSELTWALINFKSQRGAS